MNRLVLLAVAALALAGGSAAAAPRGSGLGLTDAVAREAAATVTVRHRDAACLGAAAQKLTGQPEVRKVAVSRAALRVTYPTAAIAAEAAAQVRSTVDACAGATVAGQNVEPVQSSAAGS